MMWVAILVLAACIILLVLWCNGLVMRLDEHEYRIRKIERKDHAHE